MKEKERSEVSEVLKSVKSKAHDEWLAKVKK
jgi:hypothetical protein